MAPAGAGLVLHKPFNKFPYGVSVSTQANLCATYKTTKMPTFSPKTGVFTASGSANAPKCAVAGPLASYADWDGSFNFQGPFMWSTNGSHQINITWKAVYSMAWSIAKTKCILNYNVPASECYAGINTAILLSGLTYDQFNFSGTYDSPNSTFIPQGSAYVDNFSQRICSPTCSITSSNTSSLNLTGSLSGTTVGSSVYDQLASRAVTNDTHTYELYFTVILLVFVEAYTFHAKTTSPLTATASINMGTLGNAFTLGTISFI